MDVRGWSVIAVLAIAGCSGRQAASVEDAAEVANAAPAPSLSNPATDAVSARVPTASSTTTAAPGLAQPEGHFLEGERMLLNEGAVSAQKSEAVLGSDKAFAQAISQFERDAAGHLEVQDLTRLYRAAATRLIGNDGTLVSLLEAHQPPNTAVWALYPQQRHLSPKVRQLVEFLKQGLAQRSEYR